MTTETGDGASTRTRGLPEVVSPEAWREAREALLAKEKAHTRARDALAAERRRLPMVEIEKAYVFEGPSGDAALVDLFEGRRQLVLYHFMFGPNREEGCDGCSMVVDNMGHPAHLNARGVTRVLVSRAPRGKIEPFRERMGWTEPWYSSHGTDFNPDFGVGPETPRPDAHQDGETFGLSVFLRDGDRVFRTYFTDRRGVEYLGSSFSYLDLTPFGRRETWEDTPEGRPQGPPYAWWRHHDRYDREE
ncbi:MAG: DUF899 domain-containing protein [Gemmatimonadota bacterium]